jgi:hypothetical protein
VASKAFRLALLAALSLAAGLAHAQQSLTNTRALAFGRFVAASGGSVTVSPDGARSSTGAVVLLSSMPAAASFTWTDTTPANADKVCLIGLPADGSVTLSSSAGSMAVDQFTSNPSGTGLMTGASLQFTVGATLSVNPNQAPGNYSGFVPVTIQYQ